ncbi:MAG: LPS export ABC transporter periplasmic protein LptC [Methylotenera sp.]|nr:MAG: LPS export ABC transporter periplasmic protein LptC [Methylotenera sp.]
MSTHAKSVILFPIVLLSLLATVTFWINMTVQPVTPKIDGSSRHDPDYIVSNFVTTQTDANGDLRYKLAATEMKHFPDNDTTNLLNPRYTQFAVNKPYTQVEGLRGYVSSNGEVVEIVDKVLVTRQAFADKGEMTLETDYLNIRPNEELVQTTSPVVIRQAPKTVIYATGMIYEKKKQTVTLLNKVRAHYERPIGSASQNKNGNAKINTSKAQNTASLSSNPMINNPLKPENSNTRIRRRYE